MSDKISKASSVSAASNYSNYKRKSTACPIRNLNDDSASKYVHKNRDLAASYRDTPDYFIPKQKNTTKPAPIEK